MSGLSISGEQLSATIAPLGAELRSLTDVGGRDYLWNGDPRWWSGRAPLLFPIVGRLNDDTLRLDDRRYNMPQHGFARRSTFEVIEHDGGSVRLRLRDDATTRAVYPFAFELDAAFTIDGTTLATTVTVRNTGDRAMPASFGFHPAFVWPLPGTRRNRHWIMFERDEPADLHVVTSDGLVGPATRPSPILQGRFGLDDSLFAHDALVWIDLHSRRLRYGTPDGAALDIAFPDTPHLGLWTKPGAPFVCVEPWAGYADPPGYDGDFRAKPGVFIIAPGDERRFRMDVTIERADG